MRTKRVAFAVQGEGRGHLTQAIALAEILKQNGHELVCIIVGSSSNRQIPEFFVNKFSVPIISVASPNFITDKKSKSINLTKTITTNFLRLGTFSQSVKSMRATLKEHRPDLLVNFYEPLVGWLAMTSKPTYKIISIAHQYIYLHDAFRFPGGKTLQSAAITWYTKMTAFGSSRLMALSMYDLPPSKNKALRLCPPLLRKELFKLKPKTEDFILVYLLNSGYIPEIVSYHQKDPSTKIICFTDSKEVKLHYKGKLVVDDHLTFHSLNDINFLDLMSRCKALVCTAGFESVCEAMYLDKPVMMVPVQGHYEQFCNARDASRIGAGIYANQFDLSKLKDCLDIYNQEKNENYRDWVNSVENIIMKELEYLFYEENPTFQITFPTSPYHPSRLST